MKKAGEGAGAGAGAGAERREKENEVSHRDRDRDRVPFLKLFSFADSIDKMLMVVGGIAAAANGLSTSFISVLLGESIDTFGENSNNHFLLVPVVSKVCMKFVVLAAVTGVAAFFQVACWMISGERQAGRIRTLYLKAILSQDIAFFDQETTNTGAIVHTLSGDTVLIQDAIGEKVGKLIQLVSTFVGGFAIAFVRGWLLTFVMLSSIPPMVFAGGIGSLFIAKMASNKQKAYTSAATVVEQTVGSIKTVASFTGEKHAVATYNKSLQVSFKSGIYEEVAIGLGLGMSKAIAFFAYALAIWFGAKLIVTENKTGGEVLNVIMAVLTGAMSLGQASPCMGAIPPGQAAAYKIFDTISRKAAIDGNDTNGKTMDDIHGNIELKNVHFSYPTRPEERIFSGLSLFISRGSSVALVGHSGSGKSTVISLIQRFYDPQSGEVLIDGLNLKEFQLTWIRKKIGLVSQEPVLFAASIKDNIAYGKDGATNEEIILAAKLANAATFIDKLPVGLDTIVGERGAQLSGGQRQRVAIARAILKDPRILLLDEATSALDAESERVVQDALDKIMAERTTVIVAHRLNTIRNADMIVVLHDGKLVEKGTHSELLKNNEGAYRKLASLQTSSEITEHSIDNNEMPDSTMISIKMSSERMSHQHVDRAGSSPSDNKHERSTSVSVSLAKEVVEVEPTSVNKVNSVEEVKTPPDVPMLRVAYLNKPEAPVLVLGAVVAILNGAILPVFGVLLSLVIKTFYQPPHELTKNIRFWALAFVGLGISSLLVSPIASFLFGVAGCSLIRRIRSMCFEKVVHMEVGWFDEPEHSTGYVGARLSTDVTTLRAFVGDSLSRIVQIASSVITALLFSFLASWQLTLIIIAIIPLLGLNVYAQSKFLKGFSADAKIMYEAASQVASDAVGNIRTVASFCAEERVMDMYKKKCKGPIKSGMRQGLISGIGFGVSSAILLLVIALIYYAGAGLVKSGNITFSDVFRVFFAIMMAATGVSELSSIAPDSSKAKSGIASIFDILDRKSNIDPSDESGITLEDVKGEISIQHLSFRYPTRPDVYIFQDLCLTIHSGKMVALAGESGSGKSTVISLLQRFYNPDGGHITLDGEEIQNFQLKWLRRKMGLVSQDPVLFNDTIRANIAYGNEGGATEAEITAAAELANAHNFISGLQKGYDTIVGERGLQMSGGQKQRVAIARVILRSPKIILLDEATSALDTESERVIQDALDSVTKDQTTIVVAHSLSTIKRADLIAVLKEGVIVEEGKHEDLVNIQNGFYASLVALQMNSPS